MNDQTIDDRAGQAVDEVCQFWLKCRILQDEIRKFGYSLPEALDEAQLKAVHDAVFIPLDDRGLLPIELAERNDILKGNQCDAIYPSKIPRLTGFFEGLMKWVMDRDNLGTSLQPMLDALIEKRLRIGPPLNATFNATFQRYHAAREKRLHALMAIEPLPELQAAPDTPRWIM